MRASVTLISPRFERTVVGDGYPEPLLCTPTLTSGEDSVWKPSRTTRPLPAVPFRLQSPWAGRLISLETALLNQDSMHLAVKRKSFCTLGRVVPGARQVRDHRLLGKRQGSSGRGPQAGQMATQVPPPYFQPKFPGLCVPIFDRTKLLVSTFLGELPCQDCGQGAGCPCHAN